MADCEQCAALHRQNDLLAFDRDGYVQLLTDENNKLRAEVAKLRAALHEAADELDGYYRAEYCGDHPYSKRKLAEAMRQNPARIAITEENINDKS